MSINPKKRLRLRRVHTEYGVQAQTANGDWITVHQGIIIGEGCDPAALDVRSKTDRMRHRVVEREVTDWIPVPGSEKDDDRPTTEDEQQ